MYFTPLADRVDSIPVEESHRRCTDSLCIFFSAAFAITLFAIAFLSIRSSPLSPYFNLYPPYQQRDITSQDYSAFLKTLLWTAVISISLGLLWMAVAHLAPYQAPKIGWFFAILALLAVAVLSIVLNPPVFQNFSWLRWVVLGVSVLAIILIIVYYVLNRDEIHLQGVLLSYGARFLSENPFNFFLVLIWLQMVVGLGALIVFQQVGFSFRSRSNNNLFDLLNPGFLGVLNIIELIWGLQFLKCAFIFVVSGNAVSWYWWGSELSEHNLGWKNLVCRNWGSVVCGSFFEAFLQYPFLLLEWLTCHRKGCCSRIGVCCQDNCCFQLINLVRTDSYPYTNIFGSSYCEASRECLQLCEQSPHIKGSQSPMRNYRIIATVFLTLVGYLLGDLILRQRVGNSNIWFHLVLLITVNGLVGVFVSVGASAGQGLQTSSQVQLIHLGRYDYMQNCLPSVRKELQNLAGRVTQYLGE